MEENMRVLINETPFEITSWYVLGTHNYEASGVCVSTDPDNLTAIEAAVGDGAEVRIAASFSAEDLILRRAEADYKDGRELRVYLIERPIEDIVRRQAEDIEAQAAAIEELAEIIAGGE